MGWFDHIHNWLYISSHNIEAPDGKGNQSMLRVEECCRCGAFRTIEYGPGRSPIIRWAEPGTQAPARGMLGL